jgi:LETM1 and EF-hand domain-containing protein 1
MFMAYSASLSQRFQLTFFANSTLQIQLYNSMIEKEGTDGAEEARNAFYHSSREAVKEHEEQLPADRISSALIERVCTCWMPT